MKDNNSKSVETNKQQGTSSPNISEATEADWEDFWNSESDGREFSENIDISAQPD
jgi:hypothetical protein